MSNDVICEFRRGIAHGYFLNAYETLIMTFEEHPDDPDLLVLSRELHGVVFKKAYELAYNKATEFTCEANTADVLNRLLDVLIKKLEGINQ